MTNGRMVLPAAAIASNIDLDRELRLLFAGQRDASSDAADFKTERSRGDAECRIVRRHR